MDRKRPAVDKLCMRTAFCFLAMLLCSISTAVESSGDQDTCTETDPERVSCHFEVDSCGWKNSQGNNHNWRIKRAFFGSWNEYMSLPMSNKPANTSGRLESPWLCPTGGKTFSLSFRYYLYYNNTCRLSVFLQNSTSTMEVWSEQRADQGVLFQEFSSPLYLTTPLSSFKIIFEGRKLTDRQCGNTYNEINVDDIVFREANGSVSSVTTYASTSSMTESSSHTPDVSESTTWTNIASSSATQDGASSSHQIQPTLTRPQGVPDYSTNTSDDYETPHDYQNTIPGPVSPSYYNLPPVSVPAVPPSATAAENYEMLESRRDNTEYYTRLAVGTTNDQSVNRPQHYESLSGSQSTHDYTALAAQKREPRS